MNDKLAHLYTAKLSKSGKHLVLTAIIDGEKDGEREYITIPVCLGNEKTAFKASVDDGETMFKIIGKISKPKAPKAENDELPF